MSKGLYADHGIYEDDPVAGGAPTNAEYIVGALHAGLSAERLVIDTPTGVWDLTTAGQARVSVSDNAIDNLKAADMPAGTLKGNNGGAPANPSDLTVVQATAMLNLFTDLLQGLVPASGGGTTNFLRADGTWVAPPGGGGGLSHPQVMSRTSLGF